MCLDYRQKSLVASERWDPNFSITVPCLPVTQIMLALEVQSFAREWSSWFRRLGVRVWTTLRLLNAYEPGADLEGKWASCATLLANQHTLLQR